MIEYDINKVLEDIFDKNDKNCWNPTEKIQLITKEVDKIKVDLKKYLDETDFDMVALEKESEELCKESKILIDEMKSCKREIEEETMVEICKAMEEHEEVSKELEIVQFSLDIVKNIVSGIMYYKQFEHFMSNGNLYDAAVALQGAKGIFSNPVEGFIELDFYKTFHDLICNSWEQLLGMVATKLDEYFFWTEERMNDIDKYTINIEFPGDDESQNILGAACVNYILDEKLNIFGSFLLSQILKPMMYFDCTVHVESENKIVISISQNIESKPDYKTIIDNMRILFEALAKRLNMNLVDCDETIMTRLGIKISTEFAEILIDDCLIHTIPGRIDEFQHYGDVTMVIENFQEFLIETRFFPKEGLSILKYTVNIEELFASRSSQHFLETARSIMFKDLSDTMSIGVTAVPDVEETDKLDDAMEEALGIFEKEIPKSLFYFPRCMISKSTQELLDLIYTIVEQAVQCTDFICKTLYSTTRLVFELYDAVVPYQHENFLQNIPQYVGEYTKSIC